MRIFKSNYTHKTKNTRALWSAVFNSQTQGVRWGLEKPHYNIDEYAGLVTLAVINSDISIVELLIEAGADISTKNYAIIKLARFQGAHEMVNYLKAIKNAEQESHTSISTPL